MTFSGTVGEVKTFTVSTREGEAVERDETFTVSLDISGAPSGVSGQSATGTIVNDDYATVTIADASATEGEVLIFKARLDKAVQGGLTVTPRFSGGTATQGTDYTLITQRLNFDGRRGTVLPLRVRTTRDELVEGDETFTVNLDISDAPGGVSGQSATGTIKDYDDEPPSFDALRATRQVAENSPAGTNVGDPVTATDAYAVPTYSLTGADVFQIDSATGQIRVAAGAVLDYETTPSYTVTVSASDGNADATVEVTIDLTDVQVPGKPGTPVASRQTTAPTLTLRMYWAAPGNGGSPLTGYDVQYQKQGATVPTDLSTDRPAGTIFLSDLEFNTTYQVRVRGVNAEGSGPWSDWWTGSTNDDSKNDQIAKVTMHNASATEGAALTFTLTLDKAVPGGFTVTPRFTDETATQGTDYTANTAALRFTGRAGETRSFTVSTTQDTAVEGDETFRVIMIIADEPDNPIGFSGATGTIADDDNKNDQIAKVTLDDASATEGGALIFTLTLHKAVAGGFTVTPRFTDETATQGTDYTANTAALRFTGTAGEQKTFTVSTTPDSVVEDNETFTVSLSVSNTSDEEVVGSSATGTIIDRSKPDPNRPPSFGAPGVTRQVAENSPGGTAVGDPVTATDADDDPLTYSLPGSDVFQIDSATGQIRVAAGAVLNYEATSAYLVIVSVTDGKDADGNADSASDATVEVTIELTDVDLEPLQVTIGGMPATISNRTPLTVTFHFSKVVTGFEAADITVENGTLGTLTGIGVTYLARVTPDGGGDLTVTVAAYSVSVTAVAARTARALSPSALQPFQGLPADAARPTAGNTGPTAPVSAMARFIITPTDGDEPPVASDAPTAKEASSTSVTDTDDQGGSGSTTRIDGDEPPAAPEAPTVQGASSTSVTVSWTPPPNQGSAAITDYDVQYRVADRGGAFLDAGYQGTDTGTTLGSLSASTAYEVQVRASNAQGTGPWSESGRGATDRLELTVSFTQAAYTLAKGGERASIDVNISPTADRQVEVPLQARLQGGVTSTDYDGVPESIIFAVGATAVTFAVGALADEENDPNEGMVLGFGDLPEAVLAGDPAETRVQFTQQRGAEPFSRSLQVMLAVAARSVAESAQTAIESRFERKRQRMRARQSAPGGSQAGPGDGETGAGRWPAAASTDEAAPRAVPEAETPAITPPARRVPGDAIEKVTLVRDKGRLHVLIMANGPIEHRSFRLQNPPRLVVDIPQTVNRANHRNLRVETPPLQGIRVAQFRRHPPITRVVLDLERMTPYQVRRRGPVVAVELGASGAETPAIPPTTRPATSSPKAAIAAVHSSEAAATPSPPEQASAAQTPTTPPTTRRVSGNAIEKVMVARDGGKLRVLIIANGPIEHRSFRLQNPPRLVLDIPQTVIRAGHHNLRVEIPPLQSIRAAQFRRHPPITRVVLDLERMTAYQVRRRGPVVAVELGASGAETPATTPPARPATGSPEAAIAAVHPSRAGGGSRFGRQRPATDRSGKIRGSDAQGPSEPWAGEPAAWHVIAESDGFGSARPRPAAGVDSSLNLAPSGSGRWSFAGLGSLGQARTGLPFGQGGYGLTPTPVAYDPLPPGSFAANPSLGAHPSPEMNPLDRFLPQASFNLHLGESARSTDTGGEGMVLWGQGDLQYFNGNLTQVGMNYRGNLKAAHVGMDLYNGKQALVGFSFMRSWADMNYSNDGIDGVLGSSLNTAHPYLYWQPHQRFSAWVIGGLGRGKVNVHERGRTHVLPADFRMFSGGMRSMLAKRGNTELGLRADAFTARLQTSAFEDIARVRGDASRTRMMLELSHDKPLAAGRSLSVKSEFGVRHDNGHADEGTGAETGFRIGFLDANRGLDIAWHGRVLLVHKSDYRDFGVGMQVSWDPGKKDHGLQLSMMSARGRDGGGRTTLWNNNSALLNDPLGGGYMAHAFQTRTDGEVAYGMDVFGGRGLLTPYSQMQIAGPGRTLRVGTELNLPSRWEQAMPTRFALEGIRRETVSGMIDLGARLVIFSPF